MSQHHDQIKNDSRWKAAKAACHERDGWACVRCGSTENLQADHIVRLVDAPELAFVVENLQTLCQTCHSEKEKEAPVTELKRVTWINPKYQELEAVFR